VAYKSLSSWLSLAQHSPWAIPHFNVSTTDQVQTIVEVCVEHASPLIIGVSEGEVDFIGYDVIRDVVTLWRDKTGLPIFLNADHHHSLESAKRAIDAGFDSVNIDCSLQSEIDNVAETKAVVAYAHSHVARKNFSRSFEVNVEGEIGALPTQSSEVMNKRVKIDPATLTTPDQAQRYVDVTGVDRLTPAVGTLHGIEPGGRNPHIDIDRLKQIAEIITIPVTLHGCSGTPTADIKKALPYLSNIHINTDLRVAYTKGLRSEIDDTTTPYKYLTPADEEMKKVVEKYVKLFMSAGKVV